MAAEMTKQPNGMIADIIDSIFTPGTNSGLLKAMSYSFYALFVTLFGMLFLTGGNIHVFALLGLSIGLFISIKWFLIQIADVEEMHRKQRLAADGAEKKPKSNGKKTE